MIVFRILVFALGVSFVIKTLSSAVRTFVLPRGVPDSLTRRVFESVRRIFDLVARRAASYHERDAVMALYAPVTLLALPIVWLTLVLVGYTAMYWAAAGMSVHRAVETSGSSLLTLGFAAVTGVPLSLLVFSEAILGLLLAALLIAYLPTMYTTWSRREAAVAMLEVRAGSPPSAEEMILRYHRIHSLDRLSEIWPVWEAWFIDVEESHTSLAPLTFFRSPQPDRSWITAAGTVLDTASVMSAAVDVPRNPEAALCIRAGYLALRRIAMFFRLPFDPDPSPSAPISVSRSEFEAVLDHLAANGVPLKPDRDQAWRDFAGWRVNYDTVLLELAALTMAPYAPWSSDRSLRGLRQAQAAFTAQQTQPEQLN